MKIAYINSVVGFGSTGRIVLQLSMIEGVESRIYYGRKKDTTSLENYRITNFFGNACHAFSTFIFDAHGFSNTFETERMVKDLHNFQPDIVHLHNLHGYYIDIRVLFSYLKESNVKVVWTMHDCWAFTGHCAHYEMFGCEQWKSVCKKCPAIHQYPITFNPYNVEKNFFRKKRILTSLGNRLTIVTPSYWLKNQLEQSFLKNTNQVVISNGIDLNVFHPVESQFRKNHQLEKTFILLACASIWTKEKGLDDLISLSKRLNKDMKLVVVGLKKSQFKLFSKETVCISRTQNVQELVELYSTANVFLNLTLQDTYPTVNLEALACGCPIITYQTGGSTEMITSDTGVIVKKNDIDDLLYQIKHIMNHPFDRAECVKLASTHSKVEMNREYALLYRSVLG